jgi:hypothetical protein
MGQAPTGVEVRAKIIPLAFILYLLHPKIEIDGQVTKGQWGSQFFPLAPGSHTINLWYNYLFGPANKATIDVSVYEGQVAVVTYKTRWLVFLPGKVSVEPAAGV